MTVQELMAILIEMPMDAKVTCANQDILAHMEAWWYQIERTAISADHMELVLVMIDDAPRNQTLPTFEDVLGAEWRTR